MDSRGREDAWLKRVLLAEKTRSLALPESSKHHRLLHIIVGSLAPHQMVQRVSHFGV